MRIFSFFLQNDFKKLSKKNIIRQNLYCYLKKFSNVQNFQNWILKRNKETLKGKHTPEILKELLFLT